MASLPHNHAIKFLLKEKHILFSNHHQLSLKNITSKQWQNIKSFVSNSNSHLNCIFPLFDSLNEEFCLGSRLSDSFSSHYSFHEANYHSNKSKRAYCCKLNKLVFDASNKPNTIIIISDTSIKNNVAIFIAYVHSFN